MEKYTPKVPHGNLGGAPEPQSMSLQDPYWQELLIALEQQNKERLLMNRYQYDSIPGVDQNFSFEKSVPKVQDGNQEAASKIPSHALEAYQRQLALLEQQKKKRAIVAGQQEDSLPSVDQNLASQNIRLRLPASPPNPDYQMRLILLEQQNKKRLQSERRQ
jgi:hypothetical protein